MSGPWEDYQAAAANTEEDGPWTQFQQAPQRSQAYERAYQQRADARRARTPEELRTGRVPGGGRDIPVPDFLQGFAGALQNFNRSGPAEMTTQMFRSVGDDVAYWATRPQGREQARAAQQYEQDRQRQVAREQPILNAASIAASIPAMGGNPVMNAGRIGIMEAGVGAAGTNLPFAFARQEGNLQERLPGALQETAIVGGLGASLQGVANRLTGPRAANTASQRAGVFDRAGVRPTAAAVTAPEPPVNVPVSADPGRTAVVSRAIAENPIVGFMPMGHMRRSLGDTAARAEQVARAYGPRQGPEATGQTLQDALRRFARGDGAGAGPPPAPGSPSIRNWSFDQRANHLYDRWWNKFNAAVRQRAQAGQPPINAVTNETRTVFDDIFGRNTPEVATEINDRVLTRIRNLVTPQNSGAGRTFQDIRDIRTYVRNLQRSDPSTRPTLTDANLQRLEQALTTDMYDTASAIGGQRLARELHQVDRYYRTGSQRIATQLRPFLREGESPAAAYSRIIGAATSGGRQNTRVLRSVRASLQPYEWRQIAATAIDEMGRAPAGHPYAAEGAFSVERFATRYNAMSEDGRRALFGDLGRHGSASGDNFIDLERALNDLARVAGMQKAVERAANSSNTAVASQAVGTIGGMVTAPQITIPVLMGLGVTGEMLTNPAFVRWIVSAPRASGGVGGMRRTVAELGRLAARDPALAPYHAELVRTLSGQPRPEGENSPAPVGQLEPYMSPSQ